MKYVNLLKLLLLCVTISHTVNAEIIQVTDFVLESEGDYKFTKAIQAAVLKASAQPNGQVFIGPYKGQYNLPITPIKFYDFDIDNICYNLSNHFNLNCDHLQPGNDGLVDLKNLTISIDCGITLEALTCYFKGFDEMFGFNGIKNFNIEGYGATLTMQGFELYKSLGQIDQDNAAAHQTLLQSCEDKIPNFCTSESSPWQNTRNCRKESTDCLECWTGNHHPAAGWYENFAQGRHGIHLANSHNVNISGIAFKDIYSDGINLDPGLDQYYQWKHSQPSRNITIKDCSFTNCGRVGICFCSVNGGLVTNCAFENNGYIIAGVDIDVEPFNEQHSALGIVIQNSSFKGAANTAISIGPGGLTQTDSNNQILVSSDKRVDVTVKNCVIAETEFGIHYAGGPYLPSYNDQVKIKEVTLKRLGHEYEECKNLPTNKIQACKDSLDNFFRVGLLFDSRLTPNLVGDWSLVDVENLVMKDLSADNNGHQFTWHSMPVFIRTTYFLDYFLNNRLGCAEELSDCPNYTPNGFLFDELFGGLSLKNVILYDDHGVVAPSVRVAKPVARQEFCLVKSQRFDNTFFLPRFANVKSQNIIKVNPQNQEGVHNVLNANSFDCDLVNATYNDDFQLRTSIVKPAVSINSGSTSVYEGSIAYFTLSLSQSVNFPLSVDYQLKGNATNRLDYSYITGNTVIPANTTNITIAVSTLKDCISEQAGGERIEISLIKDADETYTIFSTTAQTKILDVGCSQDIVKSSCEQSANQEEEGENEAPETPETPETPESSGNTTANPNTLGSENVGVKGGNGSTTTNEETNNQNPTYACADETIFSQYAWLNQHVSKTNCNSEKIKIYSGETYSFVLIEDEESNRLYFQDGTYFCIESNSANCLQYYKTAYNLNETHCWSCNPEVINCTINGCTNNAACNYDPNACQDDGTCNYGNLVCENPCDCTINTEPVIPDMFSNYPYLSDLVDLDNCTGTIVQLYEFSHYNYVTITDMTGTHLYLDYLGVNLYCSNELKYYCKDLYNLGAPSASWQCNGSFTKQDSYSSNVLKRLKVNPIISPNPNKGIFHVGFKLSDVLPHTINIYTANGQLIEQAKVDKTTLTVDISAHGNGLYLLETRYADYSVTEKIIVHK